jgi:hypothetical protein
LIFHGASDGGEKDSCDWGSGGGDEGGGEVPPFFDTVNRPLTFALSDYG